MKKSFYSTALCAVFVLLSLLTILPSCNKPSELQNPHENTPIEDQDAARNSILEFKQNLEYFRDNPGLKSDETFPADSAMLDIEALLNFNFCYTNIDADKKVFKTCQVIMPLDVNERISYTELVYLYYNIIIDSIQAQMTELNYPNMKLLLVDLERSGTNNHGDAILKVGALIGNEQNNVLHDGSWWYGKNHGTCSGMYAPQDAATQLDLHVTNAMLPNPPNGCRWYFRTIYAKTFDPKQDTLDDTPDNFIDWKIFYASSEYGEIDYDVKCLSQYEMSTYKGYYITYAQDYETQTGKKFCYCVIVGEEMNDNNYNIIQHTYTVYTGFRTYECDLEVEDILATQ